jgi:hypothetical protein
VVNMGRPADSYLAPQEQPHMMPLEGDRCVLMSSFCYFVVILMLSCWRHGSSPT